MVHKHDGVLTSRNTLRAHPIQRNHTTDDVKTEHNNVLKDTELDKYFQQTKSKTVETKKPVETKVETKKPVTTVKQVAKAKIPTNPVQAVQLEIDEEGYITMDLDNAPVKGLRVTFSRREGKKRKTVGLQIDNTPCELKGGERIVSKLKLVLDKTY